MVIFRFCTFIADRIHLSAIFQPNEKENKKNRITKKNFLKVTKDQKPK